jgi:hypothetical protein
MNPGSPLLALLINLLRIPNYAAKKLPTAFQMEDFKEAGRLTSVRNLTSLGQPDLGTQCASAAVSLRRLRAVISIIFIGMGGNHARWDVRFDNINVTRRRIAK